LIRWQLTEKTYVVCDYCGFTSLHPVLVQQVEGKIGYSEILDLEMLDHIKRFPMVLGSFNKNKWLQCSLCKKHYCDDLICTRKHGGEHEH
jgi:hypothetical protein